jgi:hypothetical protein
MSVIPENQMDDCNVICPHCLAEYQAEAEDYDEQEREETCGNCGGRYILYDEFSVTHHTRPVANTEPSRCAGKESKL